MTMMFSKRVKVLKIPYQRKRSQIVLKSQKYQCQIKKYHQNKYKLFVKFHLADDL